MPVADIILTNGTVWRGLAEGACEAAALWAGRVLAAGERREVEAFRGPQTRVIDLAGRLATPGLHDTHLHLLPLGLAMDAVDARAEAAPTLDALLAALRDRAAELPKGAWVLARGYDQGRLDVRRHPTRDDLDAACPDHPVYLVRACGHVSICNSLALALAGIDEDAPDPAGGLIEKRDGRLTGLLAENGRDPVKAVLPAPTDEALVAAVERAGRYCLSLGVTSVMDAAVGMTAGMRELAAYRSAQRTARLPVRTYLCLLGGHGGIAAEAVEQGLITGVGDDMLMTGPVKIFTDGSAGGRTAWMSAPYLGEPETVGVACLTDEQCHAEIDFHHRAGCQMAIHAIGDRAIEQVLTGYEKALDATPAPDRRHRIEHCGFTTDDQIGRMRARGVLPAPQPSFMRDFGDLYVEVLGEDRAAPAYPMRAWVEAGLNPSASTDAPVTDVNPFANLHAMVTRRTRTGRVLGAQQAIAIEEALRAYTWAAAYGEHAETRKGRLVPGQLADVAVFSTDLLAAEPEAVLEARCDIAIRGGEIVHDANGEAS